LNLVKHSLDLFLREMLSFSSEALCKVSSRDNTRIIDVKVVESKVHVGIGDCSSSINGDSKEFGIVDLSIMIKVDTLEYRVNLFFRQVETLESSLDLAKLKCSGVVFVHSSERVFKLCKIEGGCLSLIDKES